MMIDRLASSSAAVVPGPSFLASHIRVTARVVLPRACGPKRSIFLPYFDAATNTIGPPQGSDLGWHRRLGPGHGYPSGSEAGPFELIGQGVAGLADGSRDLVPGEQEGRGLVPEL